MLKIAKEENQYRVELFQVNKLNTLFSDLVKQQLIELVEEPGNSVVFNLENVRFIDSSGFNVLLDVSERARKSGSQFALGNISEEVRELIALTELEESFILVDCPSPGEKILAALD